MNGLRHALLGTILLVSQAAAIDNASFEQPGPDSRGGIVVLPSDWNLFTSDTDPVEVGVVDTAAIDGKQACRFSSRDKPGSFHGLSQVVAVTAGQPVVLTAQVQNDMADPLSGTVRGQLSLEWLRGNEEVGRSYSGDWGQELPADEWTTMTLPATAPQGADRVRIVITLRAGDAPTGGAFLIDDVRWNQQKQ